MIEIKNVTKVFGSAKAVDDVSFTAPVGAVTGFLGPNGAGKTSTLRILLGLSRPDQGEALIDGVKYGDLDSPRRAVGAVLDSIGYHPGRSGVDHLRIIAKAAGIARQRVTEVLDIVELASAADRPVGGYSQGMRQRLALATALLGDPPILVLDEPANGLDPAGMAWLRDLVVGWAKQGRTVLFSSHILSEVEMVADHVVIINRGQIVRVTSMAELSSVEGNVVVSTLGRDRFIEVAKSQGWQVRDGGQNRLLISGSSTTEVGQVAAREGVVLTELSSESSNGRLEELFFELTGANARVRS